MSVLPIAESKNWGLILVPMKHRPFCVMSKIGQNSPAGGSRITKLGVVHTWVRSCV